VTSLTLTDRGAEGRRRMACISEDPARSETETPRASREPVLPPKDSNAAADFSIHDTYVHKKHNYSIRHLALSLQKAAWAIHCALRVSRVWFDLFDDLKNWLTKCQEV